MKFFNKIWIKITLSLLFVIIIIMGMVSYLFTIRQLKMDRVELRESMGRIAKQIASIRFAETEGWYVYQDWIDNIIASDIGRDLVYIAIFDKDNKLTAFGINYKWLDLDGSSYLNRAEQVHVVESLAQGQVADESLKDFDHFSVNLQMGQEQLGRVDVGFSLIDFNNKFHKQLYINLYLLFFFLLVGIIASIIMSYKITRPINLLSNALLDVSSGNYQQNLPVKSGDEIGMLARSFNYMTARLRERNTIEKFGHDLGFSFEFSDVVQLVTEQFVESVKSGTGVLFTIQNKDDELLAKTVWAHPFEAFVPFEMKISPKCADFFIDLNKPAPASQFIHNKEFLFLNQILTNVLPEIDLIVPIISQNNLLGFLFLSPKTSGQPFSKEELLLLTTLSGQAAMAIENTLLLADSREKERLKQELVIARNVQQRLLPQNHPMIPGVDIYGVCLPADEIGGDYYDYFIINENKIGLVIADVSGKGTSAAFYMAELKGMMSSLAYTVESPHKLVSTLNLRLSETLDSKVFATMIYGVLDLPSRTFTFVRAGHNGLVLKTNNHPSHVEMHIPPGIGLGLTRDGSFDMYLKEKSVILNKGDQLILYTDGVSEAMNINNSEFGEERLIDFVENSPSGSSRDMLNNVLNEIQAFSGKKAQHDDITMIITRFT